MRASSREAAAFKEATDTQDIGNRGDFPCGGIATGGIGLAGTSLL